MPSIKLQSSDGQMFEADVEVAKRSSTIRTMLEDCGMDDDDDAVVPLPNVNAHTLDRVLRWAEHHKNDPAPSTGDAGGANSTGSPSKWDVDFLKVDQSTLFELILAANYLDMMDLLETTCKVVAEMIKGKSSGEIRSLFNIRDDFTPAEKEAARRENEWCEGK